MGRLVRAQSKGVSFDRILKVVDPEFGSLLKQADEILQSHNAVVKQLDAKLIIYIENVAESLIKAGYTTVDQVKTLKWEELEKHGLPTALARSVASLFRGNSAKDTHKVKSDTDIFMQATKSLPVSKNFRGMTTAQLLGLYKIEQSDMHIELTQRLVKIGGDHRWIVADNDYKILIDESLSRLETLLAGFQLPDFQIVGAQTYQVYKAGEKPDMYFDENPFFPGTPLMKGVCPKTGIQWNKISHMIRQVAHHAVSVTKEITIDNPTQAKTYLAELNDNANMTAPMAYHLIHDLNKTSRGPTLKLSSRTCTTPSKKADPFGIDA